MIKIRKKYQGIISEGRVFNAYGRSATDAYSCDMVNALIDNINNPQAPVNSLLINKKASFYGDSLTEKNFHYTKGYHEWVAELLGLSELNNYGVSGYTLAQIYNKINSINDDADFIFVMGGVNDSRDGTALGTKTDQTTSTVYGCMNLICAKLNEKYPTQTKIFITPHFQTKYVANSAITTYEISRIIKEVCEKNSIIVYDNYALSGINIHNLYYYTTDDCHWNNLGHEKLGRNLARFMANTINYNYGELIVDRILTSIEVNYNSQGATIDNACTLEDLKQYLTVVANYDDGTQLAVRNYNLSGNMIPGEQTITVSYQSKTATFNVNVQEVAVYRSLTMNDVKTNGGMTGLTSTDGTFSASTYTTFSILELKSHITEVKGVAGSRVFIVYKNNGNGTFNCIDSEGQRFTLTPASTSVVTLTKLENYMAPTEGAELTLTLEDGALTVKSGKVICATIPDSNMIGFWSSNEPDVRANVFPTSLKTTNVEIMKATKITTTSISGNAGSWVHLTALIKKDSDIAKGNVLSVSLEGINPVNMTSRTMSGGQIFSDNSGAVSNGAWVDIIGESRDFVQVVTGNTVKIVAADTNLTASTTQPYIKIPIMIGSNGTLPFGCTITDINITINGKEKEIIKLGSFFEAEKITTEEVEVQVQ